MRKQLSKKEVKSLNDEIKQKYGLENFLSKKGIIELDENILLINNEASFFYLDHKIIPDLRLILKQNFLKKVTVDMGAVKFVTSGADVMRPGVTLADEGIQQNEIVVVVDELHNKALAIGYSLYSSEELMRLEKGKVIKVVHYVGDEIWKASH